MIIDLPSTNSSAINSSLVNLRERGGAMALGRVLTLAIVTEEESAEDAISAANKASFEHPCRVIVVGRGSDRGSARLDAQIRVGGDAGASEVIVLRLYGELADHGATVMVPLLLPDAPLVVWWAGQAPEVPAEDPIGALAQRRITDRSVTTDPSRALTQLCTGYRPGDTDLAWTRVTLWRGLLAAALDQPPSDPVISVSVSGAANSMSTDLLAAWLAWRLQCPVTRSHVGMAGSGMHGVTLQRTSGPVTLSRPESTTATLVAPDQPDRQVALPRRSLEDCLTEELRRLDADKTYEATLRLGIPLITTSKDNSSSDAEGHEV